MSNDPADQAPDPGSEFRRALEQFRAAGLLVRERIDAWAASEQGKLFAALGEEIRTYLASEKFQTIARAVAAFQAENESPTLIGADTSESAAITTMPPKEPLGFKPQR